RHSNVRAGVSRERRRPPSRTNRWSKPARATDAARDRGPAARRLLSSDVRPSALTLIAVGGVLRRLRLRVRRRLVRVSRRLSASFGEADGGEPHAVGGGVLATAERGGDVLPLPRPWR